MSHAAAEACTQPLAAGRGTGIGLQHANDQSAQRGKPLDGSRGKLLHCVDDVGPITCDRTRWHYAIRLTSSPATTNHTQPTNTHLPAASVPATRCVHITTGQTAASHRPGKCSSAYYLLNKLSRYISSPVSHFTVLKNILNTRLSLSWCLK